MSWYDRFPSDSRKARQAQNIADKMKRRFAQSQETAHLAENTDDFVTMFLVCIEEFQKLSENK